MSTDFKALGRDDVNGVESILADDAIDFGELAHATAVGGDAIFTWDYERTRAGLAKLYERAKTSQWNARCREQSRTSANASSISRTRP